MAATIDYPTGLPAPLRSGYGLQHVSPLMRTEMESGRARQRRRYTSVPTMTSVTWHFNQVQAQVFEAWFRWTLADGAEWFNCSLRTPLGLQDYECRFVEIYSGPELVGRNDWRVSADLEIRERQTLSDDYSQQPELVLGQDIIDLALNAEWPAA